MADRPTLFPSITPDSDEPFVDSTYSKAELEGMEYLTLRQIASAHPSDAVNGRMPQDELIAGLEGLERVEL